MFKKKCSLCGGRLENNRCTLCGLDNSIYEQRRPVRQSTMEPAHRVQTPRPNPSSASSSGTKSASQKKQAQHMPRQPGSIQPPRRIQVQNMQPQDKKSKYSSRIVLLTIVITVSLIVLSFILSLQNGEDDHIWSDEGYVWSDEYDTYDYSDYDPYEYVTREIPETGETYETVLGNGIYRIGVHVPEGIYRAELSEGTGSIQIKDEENGIYHYVTFGTDTEYDQVTEEEDIRLYNGADLLVDSGVILRVVTENAQPPVQEIQENPLKEPVSLEAGNYTAGSDMTPQIPQGIYDITALDTLTDEYGYSSVTLTYPNGSSEYLWIDSSDYAPVTDEYTDISAKNIVITDGTEITVEYGSVTLMPGKGYYDVDYTQYTSE